MAEVSLGEAIAQRGMLKSPDQNDFWRARQMEQHQQQLDQANDVKKQAVEEKKRKRIEDIAAHVNVDASNMYDIWRDGDDGYTKAAHNFIDKSTYSSQVNGTDGVINTPAVRKDLFDLKQKKEYGEANSSYLEGNLKLLNQQKNGSPLYETVPGWPSDFMKAITEKKPQLAKEILVKNTGKDDIRGIDFVRPVGAKPEEITQKDFKDYQNLTSKIREGKGGAYKYGDDIVTTKGFEYTPEGLKNFTESSWLKIPSISRKTQNAFNADIDAGKIPVDTDYFDYAHKLWNPSASGEVKTSTMKGVGGGGENAVKTTFASTKTKRYVEQRVEGGKVIHTNKNVLSLEDNGKPGVELEISSLTAIDPKTGKKNNLSLRNVDVAEIRPLVINKETGNLSDPSDVKSKLVTRPYAFVKYKSDKEGGGQAEFTKLIPYEDIKGMMEARIRVRYSGDRAQKEIDNINLGVNEMTFDLPEEVKIDKRKKLSIKEYNKAKGTNYTREQVEKSFGSQYNITE